jgi:hypothetical protein
MLPVRQGKQQWVSPFLALNFGYPAMASGKAPRVRSRL